MILGVLSGVVVFAVGGITGRGQTNACKADRKTVEVAIEAFRANSPTGVLPANEAALVPAFMRTPSDLHDVSGDGLATISVQSGAPCP